MMIYFFLWKLGFYSKGISPELGVTDTPPAVTFVGGFMRANFWFRGKWQRFKIKTKTAGALKSQVKQQPTIPPKPRNAALRLRGPDAYQIRDLG
ncbi:unnamed protein product [Pleuronectes platessa]|uniref:Uncharacterized protein n=1 Tax=Pleuronectes platessa TaxID=8262 RepID=A0A9N7Y525_PLEPL|nr:unnamed protein product [Pleuronectes platessa]